MIRTVLLVLFLSPLSAQTVADSRAVVQRVDALVQANGLVAVAVDFNAKGYPYDAVPPRLTFYADPNSGTLRKAESYKAYSLIAESLNVYYDENERLSFAFLRRTQTLLSTAPDGTDQVTTELLAEYRFYCSGDKILKLLETYQDEGKSKQRELPSGALGDLASLWDSVVAKRDLYNKLKEYESS